PARVFPSFCAVKLTALIVRTRPLRQAVQRKREGIKLDRDRRHARRRRRARGCLLRLRAARRRGTKVISCSPVCTTDPTETLAIVGTVPSRLARSSTSWRRNWALLSCCWASASFC